MVDMMKALSDENRLRLFHLMTHGALCVCEFEVLLDMSQSNVSRHLSKLKTAGLIQSDKDAQWVHYNLSASFIEEHKKLYDYLVEAFLKMDVFKMDLKRLNRYHANNLNCQWIAKDKQAVIETINTET